MGYIQHHAIVITSWDNKILRKARKKAKEIFEPTQVSSVVKSVVNSGNSFFIGPDGSKLGWEQDSKGDSNREEFVKWIDANAYDDGSNSLRYIEVMYTDDERNAKIENHN